MNLHLLWLHGRALQGLHNIPSFQRSSRRPSVHPCAGTETLDAMSSWVHAQTLPLGLRLNRIIPEHHSGPGLF